MSFAYTSIPGARHTNRSLITTLYTFIVFYGRYTETGGWERGKYTGKGKLDVSWKEKEPPARKWGRAWEWEAVSKELASLGHVLCFLSGCSFAHDFLFLFHLPTLTPKHLTDELWGFERLGRSRDVGREKRTNSCHSKCTTS